MARYPLQRVVCLVLAGGYGMLLIETLVEHQAVLREHPIALTPPVAAALGAVLLTLAATTWSDSLRRAAGAYGLVSLLVGAAGLVFHNAERFEELEGGAINWLSPPLLAPAAFCGLGLLAVLVLSRRWAEAARAD